MLQAWNLHWVFCSEQNLLLPKVSGANWLETPTLSIIGLSEMRVLA
jgi:hypothetical protein